MTELGLVEQFLGPLLRELIETDLDSFVTVGLSGLDLRYLAGARFDYGDRHQTSVSDEDLSHTDLFAENCLFHRCTSIQCIRKSYYSLISISTPAGRSSLVRASTVRGVGCRMSMRRLWVLISNCSRESLCL